MVAILNTTISVTTGIFADVEVDLGTARKLVADGFRSHIGHDSTAQIVSALLGVEVPLDRTPFQGDRVALCFKLNGRPPEGRILTIEEIKAIGYTWRVLSPVMALPAPGQRVRYVPHDRSFGHTGTVGNRGTYVMVYSDAGGLPLGTVVVDIVPDDDDGQDAAYPVAIGRLVPYAGRS
jgi:hypothetical protein